jgi:hypothetical protein
MTKPTKRLFLALIPLMLVVAATLMATIPVNAQSQTLKACINQELKNAIAYATLLQSTGKANDINQTFYDIGTNVIMKCMGK